MSNHQYLPSDDANPDFVGAHNPDQKVSAHFHKVAQQNNFKSEEAGRPIFDDVDFVRIQVPGDSLNIIDTPVLPHHKKRFPQQWAHYANQMEGDQRLAGKTPISMWPRLTPSQVAELQHMKFLSVEDVANASDSNLQSVGMVGGMSPFAFREAAQRFLKLAQDDAAVSKTEVAMQQVLSDNDELKRQMKEMNAKFAALAAGNKPEALVSGDNQVRLQNEANEIGAQQAAVIGGAQAAPSRKGR